MPNLRRMIAERWYRWRTLRSDLSKEWQSQYWYEQDGIRIVPCRLCPKFDRRRAKCRIPFATPIRKCITAALEANLCGLNLARVLEIGCGEYSYGKAIVESRGGAWVGIDPRSGKGRKKSIRTCYGHAASIPFEDNSFDAVFGVQCFEHFEDKQPDLPEPSDYAACLREVWRVLKPSGLVYFDAPVHLHGHEMLIVGDVARVRALWSPLLWSNAVFETWRLDHAPLPRYAPTPEEVALWPDKVVSHNRAQLEQIGREGSVYLLTMKAQKA